MDLTKLTADERALLAKLQEKAKEPVQAYPKWIYKHGGEPLLVEDEDAHKAAGPGYFESPVAAAEAAKKKSA